MSKKQAFQNTVPANRVPSISLSADKTKFKRTSGNEETAEVGWALSGLTSASISPCGAGTTGVCTEGDKKLTLNKKPSSGLPVKDAAALTSNFRSYTFAKELRASSELLFVPPKSVFLCKRQVRVLPVQSHGTTQTSHAYHCC